MSEKPQDEEVTDEEDASSASELANTFQPTVPVAPKFICGERLEKRKEVTFSFDTIFCDMYVVEISIACQV